ncbi:hypothetical protein MRB53_001390 [Persea americana]|uniref:Uncharacterized protein n=1 Tax=Persea americana TaxID=3435 RepID=A0ACC2MRI1_PERAE|nr:hypothetical protein MRB53_001390 [Persea americana]
MNFSVGLRRNAAGHSPQGRPFVLCTQLLRQLRLDFQSVFPAYSRRILFIRGQTEVHGDFPAEIAGERCDFYVRYSGQSRRKRVSVR